MDIVVSTCSLSGWSDKFRFKSSISDITLLIKEVKTRYKLHNEDSFVIKSLIQEHMISCNFVRVGRGFKE